ncbi:hypothetical protein KO561_07305 [Radiobacillus kanasensis]|nr:hypothetical protein [Radiobacillus kanasensis]UFU00734.1 hypothetical protein KO561_07305 [Radiobacillus kanasensis]
MNDTCFYCDQPITEPSIHFVNFFHNYNDREETLCPSCYKEWLEGIKE